MDPMRMRLLVEKINKSADHMAVGVYTQVAELKATCAVTQEPVPYAERESLTYSEVRVGDVWSKRVFDCAWFHITGEAPSDIADEDLCLGIDISGEGCIFDESGTPVRGITNVSSDFDRSLGFPGKRFVPFSDGTFATRPVDIWLEAGNNDLFGNFRGGVVQMLGVYRCNRTLRDLLYDYKFLLSLADGMSDRSPQKMGILYALEKVAVNVSVKASDARLNELRAVLRPYLDRKGPQVPDLTFYAVGHAHLDLAWLWPLRETRRKAGRTFATALANMKAYPKYIFGASQPQQFEWVQKDYPALFEKLRGAVCNGQLELQGGMWVEADTNITGGESLIRQFYYGKKFWREQFGAHTDILWLPDVFGFSGALPQIMRGCGCENFLTIKLSWNMVNKFPYHSFRWKGIDGSEVLVHMPPEGTYNSSGSPKAVIFAAGEYSERGISENAMMLYGIGDGGGGPGREHIEYLMRADDVCGMPRVQSATAKTFFAKLQQERDKLPVYDGEMYLERHQGTYTSQAQNKRYNRLCENALSLTEFVYALTGVKNGYEKLDDVWKEILLYQFHDIIPGSSIQRVYNETQPRYREILGWLSDRIDKRLQSKKGELCVLNNTSYVRDEYLQNGNEWYHCIAAPFALSRVEKAQTKGSCKAEGLTIENDCVTAQFDEQGTLVRLYDKVNKRESVRQGNILRVYEDSFDAWDTYAGYIQSDADMFRLEKYEVFNQGLRAGLVFTFRYGDSTCTQTVSVCEGSPLLRFDNTVDWQESAKMLRADFYPDVHTDRVTCDIQFGSVQRTMKENNSHEWAQYEVCAHKWLDMSERSFGVAILNDCKYGYRAKNGLLSINLLRSQNYPCASQDRGIHTFTYAVLPHAGDAYGGDVARQAYALNRPLRLVKSAPVGSLVTTDNEHAVIETVKPAYDGRGIIARIYNDTPENICAKITCNGKLYQTDMLENDEKEQKKELSFHPFEIKTVRIV